MCVCVCVCVCFFFFYCPLPLSHTQVQCPNSMLSPSPASNVLTRCSLPSLSRLRRPLPADHSRARRPWEGKIPHSSPSLISHSVFPSILSLPLPICPISPLFLCHPLSPSIILSQECISFLFWIDRLNFVTPRSQNTYLVTYSDFSIVFFDLLFVFVFFINICVINLHWIRIRRLGVNPSLNWGPILVYWSIWPFWYSDLTGFSFKHRFLIF